MSRMRETIRIALDGGVGWCLLDCYNKSVVRGGISYTITTRISASNHYWVMEVYE